MQLSREWKSWRTFRLLCHFLHRIASSWLTIIGIFIFLAAKSEANNENIKSSLSKYKVKDLTMHQYTILNFNDTIDKAVAIMLNGQEKEFVVMNNQVVVGV